MSRGFRGVWGHLAEEKDRNRRDVARYVSTELPHAPIRRASLAWTAEGGCPYMFRLLIVGFGFGLRRRRRVGLRCQDGLPVQDCVPQQALIALVHVAVQGIEV